MSLCIWHKSSRTKRRPLLNRKAASRVQKKTSINKLIRSTKQQSIEPYLIRTDSGSCFRDLLSQKRKIIDQSDKTQAFAVVRYSVRILILPW